MSIQVTQIQSEARALGLFGRERTGGGGFGEGELGRYLNLEILSQGDENVPCLLEIFLRGHPSHVHCQCNGEIERVEGGFVNYDEGVLLEREFGEIDGIFWGRE
jgi:hypothetical protein